MRKKIEEANFKIIFSCFLNTKLKTSNKYYDALKKLQNYALICQIPALNQKKN